MSNKAVGVFVHPKDQHNVVSEINARLKLDRVIFAAAEEAATGNGHGYFIKSPWVSTDILLNLKHGSNPSQRGLSRSEDGIVWEFPDNYPEKIKNLIRR